jgi:hypothetical protein
MPNKDGKGPKDNGPLTGRGCGKCAVPLDTAEQEITYLENRQKALKDELDKVKTRLQILEKEKRSK